MTIATIFIIDNLNQVQVTIHPILISPASRGFGVGDLEFVLIGSDDSHCESITP